MPEVTQTALVYLRRKTELREEDSDEHWYTVGGVVRIERRRVDTSSAKDVDVAATVAQSTEPTQETKYLLTHPLVLQAGEMRQGWDGRGWSCFNIDSSVHLCARTPGMKFEKLLVVMTTVLRLCSLSMLVSVNSCANMAFITD